MTPHIKILILNWNGTELLKPCLESVLKIDYANYSVLVIDNGSRDNSLEMVKENYTQVECLALDKNYGFSGGYNRSFEHLKNDPPEFILLLNNDTEVDPNILTSFIQAKDQYGSKHLFGGKIYYQENPERIWYAGGRVNLKCAKISHRGIRKQDSEKYSNPMQTDYITGCCLFTTMGVINQLNGFDEQFNMYGEDVDFCLRAINMGIHCYYWPDAKLWHKVSASMGGAFSIKKMRKKLIGINRLLKKYSQQNK